MAFGADRSVKVNLKADVSDYLGKMAAAGKATSDFSQAAVRHADKHRASWDKVGKGMAVAGGVIALGVGSAVKAFADFDAQMSQVAAVSGASGAQMKQLSDAAMKAGADTKFSASEAAVAETELAKVGISTADILGGALTGSLNLAAAGNLDLGRAAEISGQAMKIFNLQGKDVGHIADVLASGANKSAADVDTLAQALSQSGLVAAQTGLHLEDTVGVLSAFADNALMGSDAGTSLKTMLSRLTPQSEEASKAMAAVGFEAYDAQGNFVGMESLAGRLQKSFSGLSVEQRTQAMNTIFGSDAIRAANVLFRIGADGVRDYTKAVDDGGAAQRVASVNMNNLKGDWEQLGGSIETALIQAGSGANGPLRELVQGATGVINAFGKIPAPVQRAGVAVGVLAGAGLLVGGAFLTLVPRIASAKIAMTELGIASKLSKDNLVGIGKGAAKAGVALGALMAVGAALGGNNTGLNKATESLDAYLKHGKDAPGVTAEMAFGFNNLGSSVGWAVKGGGIEGIARSLGDLIGVGNGPQKFIRELDTALAEFVKTGRQGEAAQVFDQIAASAERQGISLSRVMDALPAYQGALVASGEAAKESVASSAAMAGEFNGVKMSAEDAAKAVDALVKSTTDAGNVQLSAREAARGFKDAIDAARASIKENGRSLDIATVKGRKNQAALDGVAKAALDQAQATFNATRATRGDGPAQDAFRASLSRSRGSLIDTARRFGMTKAEARRYADALLQIPAARRTSVSMTGAGAAISAAQRLRSALLAIRDRHVSVSVTTTTANKIIANPKMSGFATGGPVRGPGTGTSDSIDARLSHGEYVIRASAVKRYGVNTFDRLNAERFAAGGMVGRPGFASGGQVNVPLGQYYSAYLQRLGSPVTYKELVADHHAITVAVDKLRLAEQRLAQVRRTKKHTAYQIAAAEAAISRARDGVAKATDKAHDAQARYRNQRGSALGKFQTGVGVGVRNASRFITNLETLASRGYGSLAQQLAAMGGDEAETIAAQAARASRGTLNKLTAQVNQGVRNQQTLDHIDSITTILSAVAKGKVGARDLSQRTGIDLQELLDSIGLIRGVLAKQKNGARLLADYGHYRRGEPFAGGGRVRGPGTSTSDSIPARLSAGEYVVRARAVERYGAGFFDQINGMRFARGGLVPQRAAPQPVREPTVRQITFTGDLVSPDVAQLAGKVAQRMREDEALFPTY